MSHIPMIKMNLSCIFPKPTTQPRTRISGTHSDRLCLYLHALYIPVESCGRGHLASLTAMSCICFHMGTQGKFPAGVSCVVLWSFIVRTEFYIRKVLFRETRLYIVAVLHVTVFLLNQSCFPS